ncbi:DUF4124 domain-containing protein [Pseudomonas kuykendallii]|uniref:DUF4124 domain-containing protein n=1 Tax=Pseudomonas kuykendallii TaxID=1007099 RepID=UPI0028D034EA|nr:DUF4124 domain-containing protein [Pseudomonas kuykendallii]
MHRMILAGSLLLALAAPVSAQVYKWVDAEGITHFGSQPPQGQAATAVDTAAAPPKPAAQVPSPGSLPKLDSRMEDDEQGAIDAKVKEEVAAREAERKRYCDAVRTNLAQLQNNPRVQVNIDGQVRRLREDERQSRIAESQKAIAENCSK